MEGKSGASSRGNSRTMMHSEATTKHELSRGRKLFSRSGARAHADCEIARFTDYEVVTKNNDARLERGLAIGMSIL